MGLVRNKPKWQVIIFYENLALQSCVRHIIKFADDSVIVSLLNSEDPDHGPVLTYFIDWCKLSFLDIKIQDSRFKIFICHIHDYIESI